MEKKEFIKRVKEQLELAKNDMSSERNVLDIRVSRHPYCVDDDAIFLPSELDSAYEFIKDSSLWYLDIYENIEEEGIAVYLDHSIIAMPAY